MQESLWTFTNLFTVALVCTISGKNAGAGIKSQDLGGFPQKNYETVRKNTQTEENTSWENK